MPEGVDVVVGLGSLMADLKGKGTRWRAVLTRWAVDPRVRSLTVLDYPRFGPTPRVSEQACWLEDAAGFRVRVAGRRASGPGTRLGGALTARLLCSRLAGSPARRLLVAATPLWVPLLQRVPAARRAFDGVDDWRAYGPAAGVRARVDTGYAGVGSFDTATTVSAVLAARLRVDYGVRAQVVGNGVDVEAFAAPRPLEGVLIPDKPFAVYVGSVQDRVDLDLLSAVSAKLPVVVAGPASVDMQRELVERGIRWVGSLDVADVPGLLAKAAVGLLPHRVNPLTESMDPMKLLEYVAAGLPVVSTRLPGVGNWTAVRVEDDSDGFATAAVRAASLERVPVPAELRDRDWGVVADRLLTTFAGDLL